MSGSERGNRSAAENTCQRALAGKQAKGRLRGRLHKAARRVRHTGKNANQHCLPKAARVAKSTGDSRVNARGSRRKKKEKEKKRKFETVAQRSNESTCTVKEAMPYAEIAEGEPSVGADAR